MFANFAGLYLNHLRSQQPPTLHLEAPPDEGCKIETLRGPKHLSPKTHNYTYKNQIASILQ